MQGNYTNKEMADELNTASQRREKEAKTIRLHEVKVRTFGARFAHGRRFWVSYEDFQKARAVFTVCFASAEREKEGQKPGFELDFLIPLQHVRTLIETKGFDLDVRGIDS